MHGLRWTDGGRAARRRRCVAGCAKAGAVGGRKGRAPVAGRASVRGGGRRAVGCAALRGRRCAPFFGGLGPAERFLRVRVRAIFCRRCRIDSSFVDFQEVTV
ncbi:hypothetical protein DA2_2224 [Desulfovibrio sp. A2]|nr:hypothetical protein DA2_2224 [Desulfovibrio sp. A2]